MLKKISVVVIIIAGAAIFAGGNFFQQSSGFLGVTKTQKEKCAVSPKPREFAHSPYYTGIFWDAHLHLPTSSGIVSTVSDKMGYSTPSWDTTLSTHYLRCLFEAEGVSKAFGFHLLTKYSLNGEVKIAKQMEKKYPGMVAHFLMPTMISPWINPDAEAVRALVEKNPGLFAGLGELKMFDGRSPDDPYLIELYELAKKYNLIIMMHPFAHHKKTLEEVVGKYPEVKFLFHGIVGEQGPKLEKNNVEWLVDIIKRFPNVYYSVDHPLSIYGFKKEHAKKVVPKDVILPRMREEFNSKLETFVKLWKLPIETYPDRFLGGGTDRWHRPQYDEEISFLINEFTRSFIAKLDPAVQEQFAYKNAERLLKGAGKTR